MSIQIQPATMFLALVASTIAAMLVLLWCYWLNRDEKSPLWMALGYLFGATATLFMAGRGTLPDWLAINGGAALLLVGISFLVVAALSFNHRPTPAWIPLVAPAVWLAASAVPAMQTNADARVVVLSAICVALYLTAAFVFAVRDGVMTRVPIVALLVIHSALTLLRIPFVLTDGAPGVAMTSGWFGITTVEALAFIQLGAFLMVLLSKERLENRLRDAAQTDQLTELPNRRAFFQRGEAAVAQALRSGAPLAVIVFDLDRFKDINDTHGHPVGDAVLQTFARAALNRLRVSDFIARIGGEEFAALLPDADGGQAALVALQINQAFEAAVREMKNPALAGTASAGVADISPSERMLADLLSAADRALYEAKAMGRGQVRRHESPVAGIKAA